MKNFLKIIFGGKAAAAPVASARAQVVAAAGTPEEKLIAALKNGTSSTSLAEIQPLIDACKNLETKDEDGLTALAAAIGRSDTDMFAYCDIIEALLQAGADVNTRDNRGRTPLLIAAAMSDFSSDGKLVMDALLSGGADTQAVDDSGNTAVVYTGTYKKFGTLSSLLGRPEVQDNIPELTKTRDRIKAMDAQWKSEGCTVAAFSSYAQRIEDIINDADGAREKRQKAALRAEKARKTQEAQRLKAAAHSKTVKEASDVSLHTDVHLVPRVIFKNSRHKP